MLDIVGFLPVQHTSVDIDTYVPLKFQCPEARHPAPLYWRTGDMVKQLFQIAINPSSGAIQSATLVSYDQEALQQEAIAPEYSVAVGLPECDLARWRDASQNAENRRRDKEDRFSDEPRPFSVSKCLNSIMVTFGEVGACIHGIRAGRVDFMITKTGQLAGVHYRDLSRLEVETAMGPR